MRAIDTSKPRATDILRPPCWPPETACPHSCAESHYERVVYGAQPLSGAWRLWRLTTTELVTPELFRMHRGHLERLIAEHGKSHQGNYRRRRRYLDIEQVPDGY